MNARRLAEHIAKLKHQAKALGVRLRAGHPVCARCDRAGYVALRVRIGETNPPLFAKEWRCDWHQTENLPEWLRRRGVTEIEGMHQRQRELAAQ